MINFLSKVSEPAMLASSAMTNQSDGNEIASLKESINRLLATRLRNLKLPPNINAIFKARISRISRKMMASWCLWIAGINIPLTIFDSFTIAFPTLLYVLLFRGIVTLSFLVSWGLMKTGRLAGRETFAIAVPCLIAILTAGAAGVVVGQASTATNYLMNAILVVYSAIMYLHLDPKKSKIFSAISMILIAGFTFAAKSPEIISRIQLITLYSMTMIATLDARRIVNLFQQRLFLLNLRDEIRSTETATLNAQLSSIAYIDQLTDIPNRRYFDEICASMSEATLNLLPLSLCMIDVDYFKKLNDSLGHLQGDHCLRIIASTIRYNLRDKTDILVRYGGEEFLLLLPGTDIERAGEIAERVRLAIAGLRHANPESPHGMVTASIGIAVVNAHPVQIKAMIESADRALYRAKSSGRNRVCM